MGKAASRASPKMSRDAVSNRLRFDDGDCGLHSHYCRNEQVPHLIYDFGGMNRGAGWPVALYFTRPTSQLETSSQPSVCASARRNGPETISISLPQSVTGWSLLRVFKSHPTMGTSKRVATANVTGGPRPRRSTQRDGRWHFHSIDKLRFPVKRRMPSPCSRQLGRFM